MDDETIRLPESWHEWELLEKIGEGAFGIVFKARRRLGAESVYSAIKIISLPGEEEDEESLLLNLGSKEAVKAYYRDMLGKYIREIRAMNELRGNSHIVSIEDYVVEEDPEGIGWTIYIRMEYLKSFVNYMAEEKMTEQKTIEMGMDICRALSDCEKLHIVHRDIKPENIFVSPLGGFKLGDFSEARYLERSSSLSQRGTISYIAPEVYRSTHYGAQADIYSLGIVLYRIMNRNRDPFVDAEKQIVSYDDRKQAFERRMKGDIFPPPPYASKAFSAIILKACAFDPLDRYRNAEELRKDLERLMAREEDPAEGDRTDPGNIGGEEADRPGRPAEGPVKRKTRPGALQTSSGMDKEEAKRLHGRREEEEDTGSVTPQMLIYGGLLLMLPILGIVLYLILS